MRSPIKPLFATLWSALAAAPLAALDARPAHAGPPFAPGGGAAQRPALTVVPELAGRSFAEAQALLARSGLRAQAAPGPFGLAFGPAADRLRVAAQTPPAGSAAVPGALVTLTLAPERGPGDFGRPDRGPFGRPGRFARMPALTGLALHEARAVLASLGVALVVEERHAPLAALDLVLAQQPEAGLPLTRGATAVLSVAQTTRVPALAGLSLRDARRAALQAALTLEVEHERSFGPGRRPAFGPAGPGAHGGYGGHGAHGGYGGYGGYGSGADDLLLVLSQSQPQGARVAAGSRLVVQVRPRLMPLHAPPHAPGPYAPAPYGGGGPGFGGHGYGGHGGAPGLPFGGPGAGLVTVPSLVGLSLEEARAALEALGLSAQPTGAGAGGYGHGGPGRPGGGGGGRPGLVVVAQGLEAGSRVAAGTAVELTLAPRGR